MDNNRICKCQQCKETSLSIRKIAKLWFYANLIGHYILQVY